MSRTSFMPARTALALLAIVALQPSLVLAQLEQISAETLAELSAKYEELRRENPELEERSAEVIAGELLAISRALHERVSNAESVLARAAAGSVSASARCMDGYVLEGRHRSTDQSVTILSEDLRDCDGRGCRAYEVSAISESAETFDLSVSVVCAN